MKEFNQEDFLKKFDDDFAKIESLREKIVCEFDELIILNQDFLNETKQQIESALKKFDNEISKLDISIKPLTGDFDNLNLIINPSEESIKELSQILTDIKKIKLEKNDNKQILFELIDKKFLVLEFEIDNLNQLNPYLEVIFSSWFFVKKSNTISNLDDLIDFFCFDFNKQKHILKELLNSDRFKLKVSSDGLDLFDLEKQCLVKDFCNLEDENAMTDFDNLINILTKQSFEKYKKFVKDF